MTLSNLFHLRITELCIPHSRVDRKRKYAFLRDLTKSAMSRSKEFVSILVPRDTVGSVLLLDYEEKGLWFPTLERSSGETLKQVAAKIVQKVSLFSVSLNRNFRVPEL